MGWLRIRERLLRLLEERPLPPPVVRPALSPTAAPDTFEAQPVTYGPPLGSGPPDTSWWPGRPLREARNAHRTNTREQFEEALAGSYNWFEGDVRPEINHPDRLEMRHDETHESGDNLTLLEWLTMGRDAGRGLKLDVKDARLMHQLLDTVEEVGIADELLMFNLSDADMAEWGDDIRARFPGSILALNPPGALDGQENREGPLEPWQVDRMIELALRFGGPVTFVVRHDRLTPEAVERLSEYGPVSVWGQTDDVALRTCELRAMGVDGVIDLAPPHGTNLLDAGYNLLRTGLDKIF